MSTIVDYARTARDGFAERPLGRVDALCLSWLAYLRFPEGLGIEERAGLRLLDLSVLGYTAQMTAPLHDAKESALLFDALAASPRFSQVRACLHVSESSETEGMQFSATTFVLPDGAGSCVCYRGTDDTVLGWKENFHFACAGAIPAQRRAVRYLEDAVSELGGSFWACGHSKGGALAAYAAGMANDETRAQITACYSHDGPGLCPEITTDPAWHSDVPLDKTVPQESLVGMLFERSQSGLAVVRSTAEGVMQHAPFTWEVAGKDFVYEQGMSYDAWRMAQRVNDWLEATPLEDREAFADLLAWLADATGEQSCSGLLRRWNSNSQAMRAALAGAPAADRALFDRVTDELVTTLVLGSAQEHARAEAGTREASDAAARRIEDLTARANDHFSKLDRLTGGR